MENMDSQGTELNLSSQAWLTALSSDNIHKKIAGMLLASFILPQSSNIVERANVAMRIYDTVGIKMFLKMIKSESTRFLSMSLLTQLVLYNEDIGKCEKDMLRVIDAMSKSIHVSKLEELALETAALEDSMSASVSEFVDTAIVFCLAISEISEALKKHLVPSRVAVQLAIARFSAHSNDAMFGEDKTNDAVFRGLQLANIIAVEIEQQMIAATRDQRHTESSNLFDDSASLLVALSDKLLLCKGSKLLFVVETLLPSALKTVCICMKPPNSTLGEQDEKVWNAIRRFLCRVFSMSHGISNKARIGAYAACSYCMGIKNRSFFSSDFCLPEEGSPSEPFCGWEFATLLCRCATTELKVFLDRILYDPVDSVLREGFDEQVHICTLAFECIEGIMHCVQQGDDDPTSLHDSKPSRNSKLEQDTLAAIVECVEVVLEYVESNWVECMRNRMSRDPLHKLARCVAHFALASLRLLSCFVNLMLPVLEDRILTAICKAIQAERNASGHCFLFDAEECEFRGGRHFHTLQASIPGLRHFAKNNQQSSEIMKCFEVDKDMIGYLEAVVFSSDDLECIGTTLSEMQISGNASVGWESLGQCFSKCISYAKTSDDREFLEELHRSFS